MTTLANQLVPELSVSDFKKSLLFYVNVLGFSVDYQREEERFAFLTLGDAQIMIEEIGIGRTWETGKFHYPLGRGINFQVRVKSITPLIDKLKQHNIALFLEAEERWYRKDNCEVGQRQFLVMDPDGYLFRFTEDLGTRFL